MKIFNIIIDKNFIARHRLRFVLGNSIAGTFFFIFSLLTFAKVWEDTFIYYHIPTIAIFIGMPVFYTLVCWYVGYIYDVKGFWKEETSHTNRQLNPEVLIIMGNLEDIKMNASKIDGMIQSIDNIKERVEKIEK